MHHRIDQVAVALKPRAAGGFAHDPLPGRGPLRKNIRHVIQHVHQHDLIDLVAVLDGALQSVQLIAGVPAGLSQQVHFPFRMCPPEAIGEPILDVLDTVCGGEGIAEEGDATLPGFNRIGVLHIVPKAGRIGLPVAGEPPLAGLGITQRIRGVVVVPVIRLADRESDRAEEGQHEQVSCDQSQPGDPGPCALDAFEEEPGHAARDEWPEEENEGGAHGSEEKFPSEGGWFPGCRPT